MIKNTKHLTFVKAVSDWYNIHSRSLPWRETKDPYAIWLSEIILQQTRVAQGMPYYNKFIKTLPTVQHMALAQEQEILRLWQGLGYYSRARNLHATARHIWHELGGQFPDNYKDLLKLKGVGPYTAAAMASFAFGERVAVADGNVYRVLSRYYGRAEDIATTQGRKAFQELAQEIIACANNPALHNQAIMEFGALQCVPASPMCMFCPLQEGCVARATGRQADLPVKTKNKPPKEVFFNYFVFITEAGIYLKKRSGNSIWKGLYDFPLIETDTAKPSEEVFTEILNSLPEQDKPYFETPAAQLKHQLTHRTIQAGFYIVKTSNLSESLLKMIEEKYHAKPYSLQQIEELPKPRLIDLFIELGKKEAFL